MYVWAAAAGGGAWGAGGGCRAIAERPICQGSGIRKHFIDDRLDTLTAVQEAADLRDWNLYLADWY
jgi:hypothetical protein